MYSQLTYVPDDNFELELIAQGFDSGPLNDYVPTASIDTITSLDLVSEGIADLTGIEDFVSLVFLNCSYNNINSLDFSTNLSLKNLYCNHNDFLTALDISLNADLEVLQCNNCQLSTIDLTQNTQLKTLQITNNVLPSIDLSQNTELEIFYVNDNLLTSLDCSANSNLSKLWCDDNLLTNVDLSQNSLLEDLDCNTNQLTSLDVSQCVLLDELDCWANLLTSLDLSTNVLLREVVCANNDLTSLNLSSNLLLEKVNCSGNQITFLDLSLNANLTYMNANGNQLMALFMDNGNNLNIPNADFRTQGNPNLFCVQVDDVSYSNSTWFYIDSQTDFSTLCDFNLVYVPDDNFEQKLIDFGYDSGPLNNYVSVDSVSDIVSLSISGNNIADLTGIEAFESLQILWCGLNQLTELNLSQCTDLIELQCSNNQITELDLSNNINLQQLYCGANDLVELETDALVNLTHLYCNFNDITHLYLSQNTQLIELNCSNNELIVLDVKNGNNTNITLFNATNNSNLVCIQVDDEIYSDSNWPLKDVQSDFNEICDFNYTFVPDDNFEQELIDLGVDLTLNDYVLTASVDTIQSLNLANKSIADFTGLENFSSLELLNMSNNLDLDVDLSPNLNLISLDCSNNPLVALRIQNGNNYNFIFFNAINNSDLECIQVDGAAYSTNNWSLVDVQTGFSEDCHYYFTWVPDDNFEAELIALGYDAGPLDNLVSTQNIASVTVLDVSDLDIYSLEGIQDFEALIDLNCSNNEITNLDLSKSLQLQILRCSSNQIQFLDLSPHSSLTYLRCPNNPLIFLNVKNGNNMAVTYFNAIEETLSCIEVDDAAFSNANWPNIHTATNFSEDCGYDFVYIPDDAFEQRLLDLGYDSGDLNDYVSKSAIDTIISIDVSNLSINDLTGIEHFTDLKKLYCGENNLVSLDVSQNLNLTNLYCNENLLTTLDLSQNNQLKILLCNKNDLQELNVKNGNNTNVTYFITYDNPELYCIQVDNPAYSTANWILIDDQSFFSSQCLLDVIEKDFVHFEIYPNPTDDMTSVFINTIATFVLSDIDGRVIYSGELQSGINSFSFADLNSGMYFFVVESEGILTTKKLIIY